MHWYFSWKLRQNPMRNQINSTLIVMTDLNWFQEKDEEKSNLVNSGNSIWNTLLNFLHWSETLLRFKRIGQFYGFCCNSLITDLHDLKMKKSLNFLKSVCRRKCLICIVLWPWDIESGQKVVWRKEELKSCCTLQTFNSHESDTFQAQN